MKRPRVEVREGVIHFVFEYGAGHEHAVPLTQEGATEFVLELASKLEELKKNPELMKKLAGTAANALVDWFTKKG